MRFRVCFVLVLALTFWGCGESVDLNAPEVNKALEQIRPEGIRAHMAFLADDLLEGRAPGTRGYQLAAKYVAAQFEAMGLEPAGVDGTYFQPVPLREIKLVEEDSSLTLFRDGREVELKFGEDFVMRGNPLRTETSVEAPVVFVGFGVTAPELDYDDYDGVDVKGKIVAMLTGAPASFPHNQRAYHSSGRVKSHTAVAQGAMGSIFLRTPENEKRAKWDRRVRQSKVPGMRWLDEMGTPNDSHSQIRGRANLSRPGAEKLFGGAPKSLEEVFAAAEAGEPQAFALPVKVRIRTISRHRKLESPNVVAVLPGSDPKLREEYVVYTAHLDAYGVGEPLDGDVIYNGALDNASGAACLLNIARAFSSLPQRSQRSVLFLAVTAEEKGLRGSDYFAHYPTVPLDMIVANVNLDGAAVLHSLVDVVPRGAEHSTLERPVKQASGRLGLEITPDPTPEEVFFIRSDQFSFVRKGVPAVFVMSGFQTGDPNIDGAAIMQNWRQTRYHQPKDDMEQPLNFEAAAKFAQVNFLIGYLVANQTERPAWNPGDFFGEKFGRQQQSTPQLP